MELTYISRTVLRNTTRYYYYCEMLCPHHSLSASMVAQRMDQSILANKNSHIFLEKRIGLGLDRIIGAADAMTRRYSYADTFPGQSPRLSSDILDPAMDKYFNEHVRNRSSI